MAANPGYIDGLLQPNPSSRCAPSSGEEPALSEATAPLFPEQRRGASKGGQAAEPEFTLNGLPVSDVTVVTTNQSSALGLSVGQFYGFEFNYSHSGVGIHQAKATINANAPGSL